MKLKIDFVTNSSSASFHILLEHLSDLQIDLIKNHIEVSIGILEKAKDPPYYTDWKWYDAWKIEDSGDKLTGSTTMDNFDMRWFLREVGVKEDHIHYEHYG